MEVVAASFFRRGTPRDVGRPAVSASVRTQGGWLSAKTQGPKVTRDTTMLSQEDYDLIVASLRKSGMRGAMREDCTNLTEATIEAGHGLMLETPDAVNQAIAGWLTARGLY